MTDLSILKNFAPHVKASSVVISPTPIKRVGLNRQSTLSTLSTTFSISDIPQQELHHLRHDRPYRSLIDTSAAHAHIFSNYHNDSLDNSIEQRYECDRLSSPDFMEGSGFLDEVIPPSRASNPHIHDEEFVKMDRNRMVKTNCIVIPRQKTFSFSQQEP